MGKRTFSNIESNVSIINNLSNNLKGNVSIDNQKSEAIITKEKEYKIIIGKIINFYGDDFYTLNFSNEIFNINLEAMITSRGNNLNAVEKYDQRHSEGIIYSFTSEDFGAKNKSIYRAFYKINITNFLSTYFDDTIYETETFDSRGLLNLMINNIDFSVYTFHNDYLIIESTGKIDFEDFSEYCYNILIAIGFVSGKFFQDEVFIFDINNDSSNKFCYQHLRKSSFSIYHALTGNPHGYKDFISEELADELYNKKMLKSFTSENLSKLVELIHNNGQIQYALVLFNESNNENLSLLIRNNCFYVVLEVLKKFFHTIYKEQLPKDYSSKGNTDKYITLFKSILFISKDDEQLLKDRNLYLHGDIKDLEDQKMTDDMQKQITLIYRLILTYIGFDSYIIDHYCIRNNGSDNAFVKCS